MKQVLSELTECWCSCWEEEKVCVDRVGKPGSSPEQGQALTLMLGVWTQMTGDSQSFFHIIHNYYWFSPNLALEMATHFSIVPWRMPRPTEEPGRLLSIGCKESDTWLKWQHVNLAHCQPRSHQWKIPTGKRTPSPMEWVLGKSGIVPEQRLDSAFLRFCSGKISQLKFLDFGEGNISFWILFGNGLWCKVGEKWNGSSSFNRNLSS